MIPTIYIVYIFACMYAYKANQKRNEALFLGGGGVCDFMF